MVRRGFLFTRYIVVLILAALTACGKDNPVEPPTRTPSRITLSSHSATLTTIGQTLQINATVLDQENNVITGASVTWSSGNPAVATVSGSGLVTAVSGGAAQITVTSGVASASASVTVMQRAGSVAITPASATLALLSESVQLEAAVYDDGNAPIPGAAVVWSSRNPLVATVSSNGLVTAVSNGTAQITATSGGASASATITVMQTVGSLTLVPAVVTLTAIGATEQLAANVYDAGGQPFDDAEVSWFSSNPAIVAVDAHGLLTAVSNGTVLIKATANGQSASTAVTVMQSASRIEITPMAAMLSSIGETVQLTARVRDGNGHPVADAAVNWSSDDPGVATVSMQGLVTAVMNGTAQITAQSGTVSARVEVVVEIPDPDREVLVRLYNATGGPGWSNSSNWLSDAPLGEWYGVTADEDGRVLELRLRVNNLRGSLPSELANLENLRVLDLNENRVSGPIPPELGGLSNLTDFNLGDNNLSGTIPSSLGNLSGVISFKLDRNNLTGSIPSTLGNLSWANTFDLCVNKLSGSIPSELSNLSSVGFLCLGANGFTGSLPSALGSLSTVRYFHVGQNMLSGTIPSSLGNLGNLQTLLLFGNNFTGAFPRALADLPALYRLSIAGNRLTGCIPSSLRNLPINDLDFLNLPDCGTGQ